MGKIGILSENREKWEKIGMLDALTYAKKLRRVNLDSVTNRLYVHCVHDIVNFGDQSTKVEKSQHPILAMASIWCASYGKHFDHNTRFSIFGYESVNFKFSAT